MEGRFWVNSNADGVIPSDVKEWQPRWDKAPRA